MSLFFKIKKSIPIIERNNWKKNNPAKYKIGDVNEFGECVELEFNEAIDENVLVRWYEYSFINTKGGTVIIDFYDKIEK